MYLLKDTLIKEVKVEKRKVGRPKTGEKGKSVNSQVNTILKNVNEGELREFILYFIKEDTKFKIQFLHYFSHYNNDDSYSNYSKVVKEALKNYSDRNGFLSVSQERN